MLSVWPCAVWLQGRLRGLALGAEPAAEAPSLPSASTASASLLLASPGPSQADQPTASASRSTASAFRSTASASQPTFCLSDGLAREATGSSSSAVTAVASVSGDTSTQGPCSEESFPDASTLGPCSEESFPDASTLGPCSEESFPDASTLGPCSEESFPDASTLGPCSEESYSEVSTALSWATAAEEDEALDPARLGASPSAAGILRGHLDFGIADGAYDTPFAVFNRELTEAVFPFRNATQHRLRLSAELCLSPEQQRLDEKASYASYLRGWQRGDLEPPSDVRLEPESGELGPGESGRLTVSRRRKNKDAYIDAHVELRSQAEGETRPQVVEIRILRQTTPDVENTMHQFAFYAPHRIPSRRLPYCVRTREQAVWVRLRSSDKVEQVGGERGWQLLLRDQPLEGHFRLLVPFGRMPSQETFRHQNSSCIRLSIGEAIFAGDEDARELGELRGEERRSRAQDLGDLAYFSRPPEQEAVTLKTTVFFHFRAALGLGPPSLLCLPPPPATAGLRLCNRGNTGTLAWSATAPPGFLCRPAAGLLGPEASALAEVLAEEGLESQAPPPLLLIIRSAWCPEEELAAAEEAPAAFVKSQEPLSRLHYSTLTLLPGVDSL